MKELTCNKFVILICTQMDAADLLLAALDEVGIGSELGEVLDDKKPTSNAATPSASVKTVPTQIQRTSQLDPHDIQQNVKSEPRAPFPKAPSIKAETSVKNDTPLLVHQISKSQTVARDKNLNTLPECPASKPVVASQLYKPSVVQTAQGQNVPVVKKEPVLLRKMSTSMKQEVRSEAVVRQVSAVVPKVESKIIPKSEPKLETIVPNDFGGSTDIDMFSQALMQLDQTNVQVCV